MNKKDLHKELDKKFEHAKFNQLFMISQGIKFFYDEKITQILLEVVGKEKKQPYYLKEREGGYNQKRQEIKDKIKEMGFYE